VHRTSKENSNCVSNEVKISIVMDTLNGIGSGIYFIGSILFLPSINTSSYTMFFACASFEIGSTIFMISACLLGINFFYLDSSSSPSSSSSVCTSDDLSESSNESDEVPEEFQFPPNNADLWIETTVILCDQSDNRTIASTVPFDISLPV
jgi:hypothetical protein